jgi:ferredoxin/flavodoxin
MTARCGVAFISPNGSTRKVAEAIADQSARCGAAVTVADLSDADAGNDLVETTRAGEPICLFIGSPVYNGVAVPPVMALIESLPRTDIAWAVPFVTYGVAFSGVALWQMATALVDRGYRIAGAAKVVAVHSLMWQSDDPEGAGRPDAKDLQRVRRLAETVHDRLAAGTLAPVSLESLDYHPEDLAADIKAKLVQPWVNVPREVDEQACTECGECVDVCPVGAVAMNPLPQFGAACFDCFNCIRLCPEHAITPSIPLAAIEAWIRDWVHQVNEQPLSRIFVTESQVPSTARPLCP